MGCTTSKLDDLPAVSLCRDRCNFLDSAIQQRHAFSESHLTYTQTLKSIGPSLHTFINKLNPQEEESGSGHIQFDSDSDSVHSSPLHHHLDDKDPTFTGFSDSGTYLHMNYMENSSMAPSVVYEERPSSPKRVYVGESSSSSYLYQSKPESWDFLNLFDYGEYTLSEDSREVREEEGIPDLEELDEVVKEVHGKEKFVEEPASSSGASLYQSKVSVSVEKEEKEFDDVVEKKVVEGGVEEEVVRVAGSRGVAEVAKEIEVQFLRAAESGNEIGVMLEVGKVPYGHKHGSSLSTVSSSQPSTSKKGEASSSSAPVPTYADIEAELAVRSRNLSSTLHKLHLWEKKLYDEVKAEERLRLNHEKKLKKLKRMDEKGSESQKVDSTRRLVRSLSTKIKIAIQVVDKVSITINKIRDEELWLQLNELIKGLSRMWKSMLDCHQSQCEAIKEARGLGSIKASKKLSADHLEATRMLRNELIDWILGFSRWVSAQKGFVRELNSWLMKCLIYEPEETADGIVPFSPGRIGAPVIFVIVHQWEQALDRISEKEVIEAMRRFTTSVLHLWEQDRLESQERMMGHGGEEQRIQKEIQELERKMVMMGQGEENIVYQSDASSESLQGSLRRIFEAMEKFTAESMRAYEDLLERTTEEENGSRESEED